MMSIADFYDSGQHQSNLGHFAALVNLASVDNTIDPQEEAILKRLAFKLDVSEEEYKRILKNPESFAIMAPYDLETRMERIEDFFKIIYADHVIDGAESKLIHKYAIALGFSEKRAKEEIKKCIEVFGNDANVGD